MECAGRGQSIKIILTKSSIWQYVSGQLLYSLSLCKLLSEFEFPRGKQLNNLYLWLYYE